MKGKLLLLSMALALVGMGTVSAHDIYVYTTGNYTPVQTVRNIRSIVVSTTGIQINGNDGSSANLEYADFDYFRFYATPLPAGIKRATADEATIDARGDVLSIQVCNDVNRVDIVSTSGVVLARLTPGTRSLNYNMSALPKGILIVKVVAGDKTYVKKILKK